MLVLADAFEEFRTLCMKPPKDEVDRNTRFDIKPQLVVTEEGNYELDRAYYVSAPQLSWDGMLKQTRAQLELITDPEMDRMLASSIRAGICMISGRYSKANNKYMGSLFDPTKPTNYIIKMDANNLSRKVMSYPRPQSGLDGSRTSSGLRPIVWRRYRINTRAISSSMTWSIPLNSTTHTKTIPSHRRESL